MNAESDGQRNGASPTSLPNWEESGLNFSKNWFPNLPVLQFFMTRRFRASVVDVKEILPAAARPLKLTIVPWSCDPGDV